MDNIVFFTVDSVKIRKIVSCKVYKAAAHNIKPYTARKQRALTEAHKKSGEKSGEAIAVSFIGVVFGRFNGNEVCKQYYQQQGYCSIRA